MKIKELFYNKSGVVLLSTILLAIAAFYYGTQQPADSSNLKEVLFSIGSSLIATALFTIFYNVVTYKITTDILEQSISEKLKHSKDEILQGVQEFYKEFVPSKIFEATNTSVDLFDLNLKKEIEDSDSYYFRGISGKRTAIRIELARGKLSEVKLNLLDPSDDKALQERANLMLSIDRKAQIPENVSDVKSRIVKDVISCLTGLYYYGKAKCQKIQITFQIGTSSSRIELLDNAIFISLYDDGHLRYPETLKFSYNTKIYRLYQLEFQKEFEQLASLKSLEIKNNTTEDEFLALLNSLSLGTTFTKDSIIPYREEYERLRSKYLNMDDLYSLT